MLSTGLDCAGVCSRRQAWRAALQPGAVGAARGDCRGAACCLRPVGGGGSERVPAGRTSSAYGHLGAVSEGMLAIGACAPTLPGGGRRGRLPGEGLTAARREAAHSCPAERSWPGGGGGTELPGDVRWRRPARRCARRWARRHAARRRRRNAATCPGRHRRAGRCEGGGGGTERPASGSARRTAGMPRMVAAWVCPVRARHGSFTALDSAGSKVGATSVVFELRRSVHVLEVSDRLLVASGIGRKVLAHPRAQLSTAEGRLATRIQELLQSRRAAPSRSGSGRAGRAREPSGRSRSSSGGIVVIPATWRAESRRCGSSRWTRNRCPPANSRCSVSSSYSTMPTPKMSLRRSTGLAVAPARARDSRTCP